MIKSRKFSGLQEQLPTNINKVDTHSRTVNSYFTIIGEEGVGIPEDHYEQLETLKHANSGELFVCTLSSCPGGSYSGLLAWKNALEGTEARTVAILEGDLASAGTILPNFFDEVHVTPYTTYMVHSANLGIYRNTAANVERNASFQAKQMERFLREAYTGFLEDDLLQKVIDGVELYMDEFEIQERLERRAEKLAEEASCEESSQEDGISFPEIVPPQEESPKKPVRKTTAKKK